MPSHQIPLALAPFVGRVQELGALAELPDRSEIRLLTLTGAGGSGKTRLPFELVRQIAPASADGVVLVDLAPRADATLVGPAIAQALDLPNDTQVDALIEALRDRALLLLLDNFEHVLEAAPRVVRLLAECPKLRVLPTSRAVLGVSGEHVFFVEVAALSRRSASSLSTPTADCAVFSAWRDRNAALSRRYRARGDRRTCRGDRRDGARVGHYVT